ncbi:MAG: tail fiber domain-containing protein [Clostridia bacterium]
MTIKELMDFVDRVKPNAFSPAEKTVWLNEVEGMVQTDVLLFAEASVLSYVYDAEWEGTGVCFPDDRTMVFPAPTEFHAGGELTVSGCNDYAGNDITAKRVLECSENGSVLTFEKGTFHSIGKEGESGSLKAVFDGSSTELLVSAPYHKIYYTYVMAMIDFANGEYNRYQNTMALFNSFFDCFTRWYAQTYRPADGENAARGYYVSAYAIAVKHGFTGSEEEWLASLKGAKGDAFTYADFTSEQLELLKGKDAVSPSFEVSSVAGGHKVTLTDAEGTVSFDVLDGTKGDQGPRGIQGEKGDPGDRGEQGLQGVRGEQGMKVEKGDPFTVSQIYSSVAAMNAGYASDDVPLGGFVVIDTGNVEDEDNARVYIKGDSSYVYITDMSDARGLQGPQGIQGVQGVQGIQGEKGDTGSQGPDGKSAYQSAVEAGYIGTEAEFGEVLATIHTKFGENDIISVANGGTGASTADGALTNLGAAEDKRVPKQNPLNAAPNDLLEISKTGDMSAGVMQTSYIATEDSSTLVNSPVTEGAFYAVRDVYVVPNDAFVAGRKHTLVVLREIYPQQGRVWSRMYDSNMNSWNPSGSWGCTANLISNVLNMPYAAGIGYSGYIKFVFDYGGTGLWGQIRPEVDGANKIGSPDFRFAYMHSANGVLTTSDQRLKKNITADLSVMMEIMAEIEPVAFEYSDLDDGKLRFGFIAQDFEAACRKHGVDPDHVAALQKDTISENSDMAKNIGDTTVYSLNYSEFIALNTKMIKDLVCRVAALIDDVHSLKKEIESLRQGG